jgi:hypothetical protein
MPHRYDGPRAGKPPKRSGLEMRAYRTISAVLPCINCSNLALGGPQKIGIVLT